MTNPNIEKANQALEGLSQDPKALVFGIGSSFLCFRSYNVSEPCELEGAQEGLGNLRGDSSNVGWGPPAATTDLQAHHIEARRGVSKAEERYPFTMIQHAERGGRATESCIEVSGLGCSGLELSQ